MKNAPLLNFALAVFLAISIGWLLVVGRPILLPFVTALIGSYIMVSASDMLHRLPLLQRLPKVLLRVVLLLLFALAIMAFAVLLASTVREITAVAPQYQANLEALVERIANRFDLERQDIWDELRAVTIDRIDLRALVLGILGGFTNIGATVFLVILYAAFLTAERGAFSRKVAAAFPNPDQAEKTMKMVEAINDKISEYLVAKTLINVVLGVISYAILWLFGVDFALFWAVSIGLLNYIPYVGSYLGVAFPVVLSLAQFASLPFTLGLTALLVAAQVMLGNVVEPRYIGRRLNQSPLVVLIALSVWTAMWGVPGAILAIPMTSILAIILAGFEPTRFIAVLLAERVEQDDERDPGG